jgi:protein SCO1/2
LGAAVLFAVIGLGTVLASRRTSGLPVYWTLPNFRLQDQAGRSYGSSELRGHPWIAAFIFTRCGGTCPMMTARMARLRPYLPPEAQLVSITVDPAYDTVAVLDEYAHQIHAGPEWHFLTGAQADLYRLATEGFKLEAAEAPPNAAPDEGPFLHSAKIALVDGAGRVRGYYNSDEDVAMTKLATDVARMAEDGP